MVNQAYAPVISRASFAETAERHLDVLVVDDDASVRLIATEALSAEGYGVLEAHDGASAIRMIREGNVDVVILDLGLPEISGLDVLTERSRVQRSPNSDPERTLRRRRLDTRASARRRRLLGQAVFSTRARRAREHRGASCTTSVAAHPTRLRRHAHRPCGTRSGRRRSTRRAHATRIPTARVPRPATASRNVTRGVAAVRLGVIFGVANTRDGDRARAPSSGQDRDHTPRPAVDHHGSRTGLPLRTPLTTPRAG